MCYAGLLCLCHRRQQCRRTLRPRAARTSQGPRQGAVKAVSKLVNHVLCSSIQSASYLPVDTACEYSESARDPVLLLIACQQDCPPPICCTDSEGWCTCRRGRPRSRCSHLRRGRSRSPLYQLRPPAHLAAFRRASPPGSCQSPPHSPPRQRQRRRHPNSRLLPVRWQPYGVCMM